MTRSGFTFLIKSSPACPNGYSHCRILLPGIASTWRDEHAGLPVDHDRSFEPDLRLDSVIEAPRRKHSQKPECLYERLERLYPGRTKLELFARGKPRTGWAAWGNQVDR